MDEIQELTGGVDVRVKWLGKPEEWISVLREGEIRLKGISFHHRKIPVPISHIEGSFLFSPEQIRFDGLKGKLGDSPFTVSGSLSRISTSRSLAQPPKTGAGRGSAGLDRSLSFQIFSSQLDLDPLFPKREKTTPTSYNKLRDRLSNWSFDGKVIVEQGKYLSLRYQDLKAEMKTVDGKLLIHPFQFKADGGDAWGEGWIQPTERGIRFEIKPRISNMEAKAFLRTLLQKGEEEKVMVSGRIHIDKVELRGRGRRFPKGEGVTQWEGETGNREWSDRKIQYPCQNLLHPECLPVTHGKIARFEDQRATFSPDHGQHSCQGWYRIHRRFRCR